MRTEQEYLQEISDIVQYHNSKLIEAESIVILVISSLILVIISCAILT